MKEILSGAIPPWGDPSSLLVGVGTAWSLLGGREGLQKTMS